MTLATLDMGVCAKFNASRRLQRGLDETAPSNGPAAQPGAHDAATVLSRTRMAVPNTWSHIGVVTPKFPLFGE